MLYDDVARLICARACGRSSDAAPALQAQHCDAWSFLTPTGLIHYLTILKHNHIAQTVLTQNYGIVAIAMYSSSDVIT